MGLDVRLFVSKDNFESRIEEIGIRMGVLDNVISRYQDAKKNLDQFMEEGDSNYQAMCERIDVNIKMAKDAYQALEKTKLELQETVNKMEGMGSKLGGVIQEGIEAAKSTAEATIKISSVL